MTNLIVKWGILLNADKTIFELLQMLQVKGKLYSDIEGAKVSIGQGLNLSGDYYVDKKKIIQFDFLKEAAIPIMTNDDGAVFELVETNKFIIDKKKINKSKQNILSDIGIKMFDSDSTKKIIPILILPRGVSRHYCALNSACAYSSSSVDIYDEYHSNNDILWNLWLFCNSSILWLLREISGRKNLGGGLLKAEAIDLKSLPIYFEFNKSKEIKDIILRIRCREAYATIEEINSEEHKAIDRIVFDYLRIDKTKQVEIIRMLTDTLLARSSKSKT